MSLQTKHFYEFGPFRLDPKERLLSCDDRPLPLPPKVLETLFVLVENAGHLVDKDELMKRVWPDAFVEEGNLNKHIFLLRKALGHWDGGLEYIETVPKRGYRFAVPVTQSEGLAPEYAGIIPLREATEDAGITSRKSTHSKLPLAVLGTALVLAIGGLIFLRTAWRSRDAGSIRSLAVLPLENVSGDAAQDYFAEGMTDELITDLGQIGSLRVISRTSIMRYKGIRKPLPQIARELHVDAIVEGTVMLSADQVRVTAQLIEASSDQHLWARQYQGDLRDAIRLQNEIAEAIANQVHSVLIPHEQLTAKTVTPESYQAYWKGEYFLDKLTPESVRKAADYFQEAVIKDPDYVAAYNKLSASYQILGNMGALPLQESRSKAQLFTEQALRINPQSGPAHAQKGWGTLLNDLDFATAGVEFRRAVELNPNGVEGHQGLADYYAAVGQVDQAVLEMYRAQEMDPLSLIVNFGFCRTLYFARRFDEALAHCKAILELDPNSRLALWQVEAIYKAKGMDAEAVSAFLQAAERSGAPSNVIAMLKDAQQKSGLRGVCEAWLIYPDQSNPGRGDPLGTAALYACAGNKEKELASLERALDQRSFGVVWLGVDPTYDNLRSDRRFQELLRRMHFQQQ